MNDLITNFLTRGWLFIVPLALSMIVIGHAQANDGTVATPRITLDTGKYNANDGTIYEYKKYQENGEETVQYESPYGETLNSEQLRQREANDGKASKIDRQLVAKAKDLDPAEYLEAVIILRNQPARRISKEIRQREMPNLNRLRKQIQDIQRSVRPDESLSPEEEEAFVANLRKQDKVFSADQLRRHRALSKEIEDRLTAVRDRINHRIKTEIAEDQADLTRHVVSIGGKVRGHIYSQNALEVTIPAGMLDEIADNPLVARMFLVPPVELELDNQAHSLGLDPLFRTDGFWNTGIDGGVWDIGVLDTGVQQDHLALTDLGFLSNYGTTDTDGHGTAVAGIIASNNGTFTGMAFGMDEMLVGNCLSDVITHADWMVSSAADDPEAINMSCNSTIADDIDYNSFDKYFDGLVDNNRVLFVNSAGNEGDGTTTIKHPASAYNILAVANMDDQNTVDRDDDFIRFTSSRGPTLNGRKKPDISAPGHNTHTTNNDWDTQLDFIDLGGTSAAAPHVAGGVLLLTDLRGNDNPMASKATLLNTADAWTDNGTSGDTSDDDRVYGSEWNKTYGWGYLDLWEAWFNGNDVFVDSVDDGFTVNHQGPDFKLYKGKMYTNEKATLVWNRHVEYNGDQIPTLVDSLSDLDLYIYESVDGKLVGHSTSSIDNVEQVAVATSSDKVIKVDVFGTTETGEESYALSTEENFELAVPPNFAVSSNIYRLSNSFYGTSMYTLTGAVQNSGSVSAFNNELNVTLPAGMSLIGINPANLGTITAGGSATASWTVICTPGTSGYIYLNNRSYSYNELFTGSASRYFYCY